MYIQIGMSAKMRCPHTPWGLLQRTSVTVLKGIRVWSENLHPFYVSRATPGPDWDVQHGSLRRARGELRVHSLSVAQAADVEPTGSVLTTDRTCVYCSLGTKQHKKTVVHIWLLALQYLQESASTQVSSVKGPVHSCTYFSELLTLLLL